MLGLQKWPIESSCSQRRGGWHPQAYCHKGSSVLWAQGSIPAPLAGREQHFLIRPRMTCQGWTAPTDCSFPFSSPGSTAGLECSPCCQAPPPLRSPHPTHFHSLPEPAPLEQDKQPRGLSHAGPAAAQACWRQHRVAKRAPISGFWLALRLSYPSVWLRQRWTSLSLFPHLEDGDLIAWSPDSFHCIQSLSQLGSSLTSQLSPIQYPQGQIPTSSSPLSQMHQAHLGLHCFVHLGSSS